MAFKLPSISLGSPAKKRYTRDMSFDNNTTMPFGYCQPLMKQMLLPNSDIRVSTKQLVRLAPMPVPSFARMFLDTRVQFVPFVDVCPYFEAMLSQLPYKGSSSQYVPNRLPTTSNAFLLYFLLCKHAHYTVYTISSTDGVSGQLTPLTPLPTDSHIDVIFYNNVMHTSGQAIPAALFGLENQYSLAGITPEGADFVARVQGVYSGVNKDFIICFRYHVLGRLLRDTFIGLGFSLDLSDLQPLSLLPLLAYYKAWFDTYQVKRTLAWTNTYCFSLIKYIEENYSTDFSFKGVQNSITHLLNFFEEELANTWYVSDEDFMSIHRSSPSTLSYAKGVSFVAPDQSASSSDTSLSGPAGKQPTLNNGLRNVGLINLQVLQKLTRYINKDSIIGTKMSQWLRVHYGAEVANSLYKDVYNVGRFRVPIDVSDVFSTSDTAQGSGADATGEHLGSYGGKSVNFGENGFKFHADKHGFLFAISAIVPISSVFQGTDPELLAINNDTLPNPDYDALGFEVTPLSVFQTYNDYYTKDYSLTDKSFGFVPRYSGFKFKKNIVNGDMSRRAVRDDYSPYYLDKILTAASFETRSLGSGKFSFNVNVNNIPAASEQWRYPCRYPWLGNYNRLFYNSGSLYSLNGPFDSNLDDNFIVQTIFDVKVTDFLKPMSQSFDTYEESTDTSTVDVHAD